MDHIITSVFAEISRCSHPWHSTRDASVPLRVCIDSKAESLALTTIDMVTNGSLNEAEIEQHRHAVKKLVHQAITDCVGSLEEIGYETQGWGSIQQCVGQRGDRLVDMTIDMLTSDPSGGDIDVQKVEAKKKTIRCSKRKKSSRKLKKSTEKKVRWKK